MHNRTKEGVKEKANTISLAILRSPKPNDITMEIQVMRVFIRIIKREVR
jgi:hypothetical protein